MQEMYFLNSCTLQMLAIYVLIAGPAECNLCRPPPTHCKTSSCKTCSCSLGYLYNNVSVRAGLQSYRTDRNQRVDDVVANWAYSYLFTFNTQQLRDRYTQTMKAHTLNLSKTWTWVPAAGSKQWTGLFKLHQVTM